VTRWIDLSAWDLPALARAWDAAAPFPHVVIDDPVPPARSEALAEALAEEPCERIYDQIYDVMATGTALEAPALQRFCAELGGEQVRDALEAVTGLRLGRLDMRGFAFHAGHYLLPHSDHRAELGRRLAYAYYLPTPAPAQGGELELFRCVFEGDEIVTTEPAGVIAARPNRLVLFSVGPASLHQVREVVAGVRLSLSGWFYP
jgi:hypothetical protein